MKNEYGIKAPIRWRWIDYDWQAIDANGTIGIYKEKPKAGNVNWIPANQEYQLLHKGNRPWNFRECIWERPKK